MKMRDFLGFVAVLSLAALAGCSRANMSIPYLQKQGSAAHMVVDGKPFLMLAGELHNSTTSSLDFVKAEWSQLAAMRLNTVLAPVYWELIEPKEGQFDFALVDGQIRAAQSNRLRLVFLWFGSWKNGTSSYVPVWVKTAQDRFPRVQNQDGKNLELLSTLSAASRDADSRAFAALMRHIKEVDSQRRVIMIQVENEVGIVGDARDRSEAANKAFAEPVPKELLDYMSGHKETLHPQFRQAWEAAGSKTSGSWEEVFGKGPYTDEIFTAWNYARYVGAVAAAGKAEYALPMYVNAWCSFWGKSPGTNWNSGGPNPQVEDAWKAGAPAIDVRSPDMGGTLDIRDVVNWYHTPGNPLFIPEASGAAGGNNVFYAVGQHDAMGFSPFGIDSLLVNPGPGGPADLPLARSYAIIEQLAPLILESQGKGKMAGVIAIADEPPQKIALGNYVLEVSYTRPRRPPAPPATPAPSRPPDRAGALFIAVGPDEYITAGSGPVDVSFSPNTPGDPIAGIVSIDEGVFVEGRWVPGRRLNGDENGQGRYVRLRGGTLPNGSIQRVKLYRYR
jgi:hypothetical protein